MPARRTYTEIAAGKLEPLHAAGLKVQDPQLDAPQPITRVRDTPTIGRHARPPVVYLTSAEHFFTACRGATVCHERQARQIERQFILGERQPFPITRDGKVTKRAGHQPERVWFVSNFARSLIYRD